MRYEILKRTWAEVNLDALKKNYEQIRACTNADAKLCCVIKADAYGHGAVRVGQEFEALGADFFGVSNLEEALQLRNAGIKIPILIFGYTPAECAETLAQEKIRQCVYSVEYAKCLSKEARKAGVTVLTHIKIDTGMNRIGFPFQEIDREDERGEILEALRLPNLNYEGIFTHFAVSDEGEMGTDFTMCQYECFSELIKFLNSQNISFDICHCANSAAILDYPQIHMNMVRAGIITYGLYPSGSVKNKPKLYPALALKSVVSHVKTIRKGDTVSYGRIFTAEQEMKIVTIPIGYADGYPRILGERRVEVLIHGKRCKIAGRVCMDQLMVDVTHIDNVKMGDSVTLIGRASGEEILADELAEHSDSINYEIVCDIGKRVPRIYLENGEIESIVNQVLP